MKPIIENRKKIDDLTRKDIFQLVMCYRVYTNGWNIAWEMLDQVAKKYRIDLKELINAKKILKGSMSLSGKADMNKGQASYNKIMSRIYLLSSDGSLICYAKIESEAKAWVEEAPNYRSYFSLYDVNPVDRSKPYDQQ